MEQQRVFTVIIAVTLFLAAILGVGLWWFYPRSDELVEGEEPGLAETFDPFQYVRESGTDKDDVIGLIEEEEDEGTRDKQDEDIYIVYGETTEADKKEPVQPDMQEKKQFPAEEPVPPKTKKTADAAPKTQTAAPKTTASVRADTPKKGAEVSRQIEPQYKTVSEWWIQTGSFKTMDRAKYANSLLKEHGITGVITTKVVNNITYYRLRVGPFSDKMEAEKFLGWISDDTDFKGSYVSLVTAQRRSN